MYIFIMLLFSVICLFLAYVVFLRSKNIDATGTEFKKIFSLNLKAIFSYLGLAVISFVIAISQI